jgi:phospholipase/lecithinase/hemolysin
MRRTLAAAAVALTLAGLAANAAPAAAFSVPNPYASGLTDADIDIGKLTAFGDSYTAAGRKAFHNWAERLRFDEVNPATGRTEAATLADFAKSGAVAGVYAGVTNDFKHEVTRWLNTAPTFGPKDLTVVYLGYNDIDGATDRTGADLSTAIGFYRTALKRVIAAGATTAGRRMLLVMPHDWGRSPAYVGDPTSRSTYRQRTQVWDGLVASTAQGFSANLVAVDLFTAMECVFDDPGAFGFTNVTDQRPAGVNQARYLYDTGTSGLFHFAARGQQLIEQVIQYYLTRGWDWSNTDKGASTARQKLVADLENGNVFPGVNCPAPAAPAVAAAQAPSATVAPATRAAPSAPTAAPKAQPLPPTAATLRALEADPAHFGVAWTRHLMARKAAGLPVPR